MQHGEHPETEQVDLHQAGSSAVVLVPLQDGAAFHASPLDGAHLDDGPVADHHAALVDAEMAGKALDLLGELDDVLRDAGVIGNVLHEPALDMLGPSVELTGRVA